MANAEQVIQRVLEAELDILTHGRVSGFTKTNRQIAAAMAKQVEQTLRERRLLKSSVGER